MLWLSGFFQVQRGKDAVVDFGEPGDSIDRLGGLIDADLMMLNALQLLPRVRQFESRNDDFYSFGYVAMRV